MKQLSPKKENTTMMIHAKRMAMLEQVTKELRGALKELPTATSLNYGRYLIENALNRVNAIIQEDARESRPITRQEEKKEA